MYSVKSLEKFSLNGRGVVFIIESPVTCARNLESFKSAVGDELLIDGHMKKISGIEANMPNFDIYIGEKIGVLTADK